MISFLLFGQKLRKLFGILRIVLEKVSSAMLLVLPTLKLTLKGFSNSDLRACLDTRRSTTCFCFLLGTSLISWKNKKHVVSRSSSKVENRALTQATCMGQWVLYLLHTSANQGYKTCFCRDFRPLLHTKMSDFFYFYKKVLYPWFAQVARFPCSSSFTYYHLPL